MKSTMPGALSRWHVDAGKRSANIKGRFFNREPRENKTGAFLTANGRSWTPIIGTEETEQGWGVLTANHAKYANGKQGRRLWAVGGKMKTGLRRHPAQLPPPGGFIRRGFVHPVVKAAPLGVGGIQFVISEPAGAGAPPCFFRVKSPVICHLRLIKRSPKITIFWLYHFSRQRSRRLQKQP